MIGVCKALQGNIRDEIRVLEEAILRRETEGYRDAANWYRPSCLRCICKSSREIKSPRYRSY